MWHDDYAGLMNLLCLLIVYAIKGVICLQYIIPLLLEKYDNLVFDTLWEFRRTWNVRRESFRLCIPCSVFAAFSWLAIYFVSIMPLFIRIFMTRKTDGCKNKSKQYVYDEIPAL